MGPEDEKVLPLSAWDRDEPAHPINDSVEVQRATQVLQLNWESITRVSVDLQNIAASLADHEGYDRLTYLCYGGHAPKIDVGYLQCD